MPVLLIGIGLIMVLAGVVWSLISENKASVDEEDKPQAQIRVCIQIMKKEMIIIVCETGIIVTVDNNIINAAMTSGVKPMHAFNSLDRAIAFIRAQIKEAREIKP
jgi:hypothetical protein